MTTKTSSWMEVSVKYDKTMEDGMVKRVTELFCVEAESFIEGEQRTIKEMGSYISTEFSVVTMKFAPYREVVDTDDENADKYYRVKANTIIIDELSGKEKKTPVTYLVKAQGVEQARKAIEELYSHTMIDYVIVSVVETKILDII